MRFDGELLQLVHAQIQFLHQTAKRRDATVVEQGYFIDREMIFL